MNEAEKYKIVSGSTHLLNPVKHKDFLDKLQELEQFGSFGDDGDVKVFALRYSGELLIQFKFTLKEKL